MQNQVAQSEEGKDGKLTFVNQAHAACASTNWSVNSSASYVVLAHKYWLAVWLACIL